MGDYNHKHTENRATRLNSIINNTSSPVQFKHKPKQQVLTEKFRIIDQEVLKMLQPKPQLDLSLPESMTKHLKKVKRNTKEFILKPARTKSKPSEPRPESEIPSKGKFFFSHIDFNY